MARGVDMKTYEESVELPFTGFAPTPQIKQDIIDAFISRALEQYPQGTQGEPEILGSCLVTGKSFSMHLRIGIVEEVKRDERASKGNAKPGQEDLRSSLQDEGRTGVHPRTRRSDS